MGKNKDGQVPNKHLYSRLSYLWQAANYMSQITNASQNETKSIQSQVQHSAAMKDQDVQEIMALKGSICPQKAASTDSSLSKEASHSTDCRPEIDLGQSRRLVSHIRAISCKSVLRLSPGMKHFFCSHCESPLIPGSTSSSMVENKSRGGRKPWADVLVITCKLCGTSRRIPLGAKRQPKRKERLQRLDIKP